MPSRPGSRDMLREASLSRPSTSHSTYSIGAATRGALSPIVSEGALSPDRVDVNDRGGVFKLTRPALPPSLPQIPKPKRKKSARSSRSSGSSRSSRRSSRGPAPAPRILERQAAFADGEWENELARSILILYGSAMGCGKEIAGQENDFAVDNDAVKALGSKVTQDEIDSGKAREAASRERREKKEKRETRLRKKRPRQKSLRLSLGQKSQRLSPRQRSLKLFQLQLQSHHSRSKEWLHQRLPLPHLQLHLLALGEVSRPIPKSERSMTRETMPTSVTSSLSWKLPKKV